MSERRASMGDKVYRGDVVKFIRNNISLGTFMKRTVKTADEACWDLCDQLNYVPAIEENPEPHWIPVTERLPETGQDVELCCGYKNYRGEIVRYICIAYHVNRYEMKYSADWDEGCDEYREEDDEYYILEGWYERIYNWDTYGAVKIDDLALAWRELSKLPEPYKGVTE